MTNIELAGALGLKVFCAGEGTRTVNGCYIGDLLSWVMGRAEPDCAWVTIMSNHNVAAVAVLADVSCVILAEGVEPDADLLKKAEERQICLLGSRLDAYALACEMSKQI